MRLLRILLVLCAIAGAAGCGDDDEGAGGAEGGEKLAPFTLAVGVDPVFTPVFVAAEEGLFAEEGLQVDVRQFSNAGEAADALVAGGVDVAGVPDYNLLARAPRADLSAFGIYAEDHGDYVKVVSAKDVSEPREMKTMGVVPGTYSEYAAAKLLEDAKVDPSTVKFVPSGPPELPPLLSKGEVDGFVIWPPWTTRAEESGDGKILMTTRDYGLGTVLTMSTTDTWLQDHRSEAQALMRAMTAATKLAEQDPAKAAAAASKAAKLPEPLTESAVGELDFKVRGFTSEDRRSFDEIGDYLVERDVVKERPSLDELLVGDLAAG